MIRPFPTDRLLGDTWEKALDGANRTQPFSFFLNFQGMGLSQMILKAPPKNTLFFSLFGPHIPGQLLQPGNEHAFVSRFIRGNITAPVLPVI